MDFLKKKKVLTFGSFVVHFCRLQFLQISAISPAVFEGNDGFDKCLTSVGIPLQVLTCYHELFCIVREHFVVPSTAE